MAQQADVVGDDVGAPLLEGDRLGHLHECDASTGGGPHAHLPVQAGHGPRSSAAGGVDEGDDVLLDDGIDVDPFGGPLEPLDVVGGDGTPGHGLVEAAVRDAVQDIGLLRGPRVGEHLLHEEAVHLGLGQDVGALLLDGVLGGQDHEGMRQRVDDSADGGLALLHGLEHGRLGLGAGAVDLVEQDDVGVDRPQLGGHLTGGGVEDLGAHDVVGHEVRRALDATEGAGDGGGQRLGGGGLGQAGHGLQQDVATGHQRGDQGRAQLLLTDDSLGEDVRDGLQQHTGALDVGVPGTSAAGGGPGLTTQRLPGGQRAGTDLLLSRRRRPGGVAGNRHPR